jgi:hypothetical protein
MSVNARHVTSGVDGMGIRIDRVVVLLVRQSFDGPLRQMDAGDPSGIVAVRSQRHGWAFGWRSLVAAEIFVTILTGFGLGHLLQYGRELSAMDQVTGVMVVIVVIGLIADKMLFSPWERFLHRRWGPA